MKQSFTKIAICSTLSLGLAVSGVGPVHSVLAQTGSSLVWIDNSPAALPSINEDDANSAGARISDLLSGKVSDPMNVGVAITNLDNAHGNWQYYNASIGLWYNIEPTSDNHVLLLKSTDSIRFVPARDWNGDTSVRYKLWDASANSLQKYSYVDSTSYSGFSSDLGSASIHVLPVNDPPYLTEISGGDYLSFDGNGDYVTFPDFGMYGNSFTVEGYLKVNAFQTWMRFFDSSIGMNNYNVFVGFDRTKMNFSSYTGQYPGAGGNITTQENFPLSQWVHVAIVYDQTQKTGSIYWDGALKARGPMDLSVIGNKPRPNNWLGKSTWAQDGDFNGGMKDVRFWSKAKSQDEIIRGMNDDLTGSEADLVANYKLNDRSSGNIAVNTGGPRNNGTISNAAWAQNTGFVGSTIMDKNKSVARTFKALDPDEGDQIQVSARSSNPSLIADQNLVITGSGDERTLTMTPAANAYGQSVITVTLNDGSVSTTYSFTLNVNNTGDVLVTGVTLDSKNLELTVGGATQTLIATVEPADAADRSVTWKSSDETVATVDRNGVVTPVGPGNATITVETTDGSFKDTAAVHVADKPSAPTDVKAIAGDGEATISFKEPDRNGGSPITQYTVIVSPGGKTVTGSASPIKVTGLDNGTPYTFTVIATNRAGDSAASASSGAVTPVPPAPGAPVMKPPVAGNGQVALAWDPVDEATGYKIFQSENPDAIDTEVATVTGSVYNYLATGLTNGTTYYFAVKATNLGEDSPASLPVSATPVTTPAAPTNVKAVAGNGEATITFTPPADNGGRPITGYEVTAQPGGMIVTGAASPITVTGLTNGASYTFTVKAISSAGSGESSAESNPVIPKQPSSGDDSNTPAPTPVPPTTTVPTAPAAPPKADTSTAILVNGNSEKAGNITTSKRDGQTVTTVALDPKKLEDMLQAAGQHAVVTIPVTADSDTFASELNGQMVKSMETKQAVLEIKTNRATFTLPAQQIDIDSISNQIGKSVALQDIKVRIEMATPAPDKVKALDKAAADGSFTLVAPPVEFTIRGIYGDKVIEVSKFNAYVERMIAIPDGVDPSKITTGVAVDPDGTVRHVPTKITVIDGKYYAKINSLTNDVYSVVWHPLEFGDAANHWAKASVNEMGSRMVIEGMGDGRFGPDRDITRAEFAAIVVRGLGLKPEEGAAPYQDVKTSDWYSGAIETASAYRLIQGFEDGTFRPNDKITREQAMAIVAKAMKLTGLAAKLNQQSAEKTLAPYTDAAHAARWAQQSIADCLQAGIVTGRSSTRLAPASFITRAEVAAVVERLLQKSDLI
ncbi:S-layer homology domain-containing protein [Paenibacillus sp. VCA1]|uniref:fibronectin type III domain-containing protein n=1 Tax=Paenibacillus sp. VCA1 TaxID=3039148 RepID=UPI002871C4F1|nr:S-layer homology domain-containing protein [Paenibacillus sp. VCA1]MDR9857582.1 S-layer homology domain-containing protein [Paenibacillus sp. VCA1]